MTSRLGRPREDVGRRMEPPLLRSRQRRTARRDARTQVTGPAERLGTVARVASRAVLTRRHRMHREPVVGMHRTIPHAPVVTTRAVVLAVTARAQPAVVSRDLRMPAREVRTVLRLPEPARRTQHTARQMRLHPASLPLEMTRRTLRPRVAARLRRQIVTPLAPTHPRHVLRRRLPHLLHCPMALPAADLATRVHRMVRPQLRVDRLHPPHRLRLLRLPALVTRCTCSQSRRPGDDGPRLRMLRTMASVTHGRPGQQAIGSPRARERRGVAVAARLLHAGVPGVVETDGDRARGEDDGARLGRLRRTGRHPRGSGRAGEGTGGDRDDQRDRAHEPQHSCRGSHHRVTIICSQTITRKRCPTSRLVLCSHSSITCVKGPGR